MAIRKRRLLSSTLAAVGIAGISLSTSAILLTKAIQSIQDAQRKQKKLHVIPTSKLVIYRGTCYGFNPNVTPDEIRGFIDTETNSITFPAGISYINTDAFRNVFTTDVLGTENPITLRFSVSDTLTIGTAAFASCNWIAGFSVYDPSSGQEADIQDWNLISIGDGAFKRCTALTTMPIPRYCLNIGKSAFYQCRSLATIGFGGISTELIRNIGDGAFEDISESGMMYVANATGTANTTYILASAMASLLATNEKGELNFYDDQHNAVHKNGSWTLMMPRYDDQNPITPLHPIPYNYLRIEEGVLKSGVKSGSVTAYDGIYIPAEVTSIADRAFQDTDCFDYLLFEDANNDLEQESQCQRIGAYSFNNCPNMGIIGTASPTTDKCYHMQALVLPTNIYSIGQYAFGGDRSFDILDLSNVKFNTMSGEFNVGTYAFGGWKDEGSEGAKKVIMPNFTKMGYTQEQEALKTKALEIVIYNDHAGSLDPSWTVQGGTEPSEKREVSTSEYVTLKTEKVYNKETEEWEDVVVGISFNWDDLIKKIEGQDVNTLSFNDSWVIQTGGIPEGVGYDASTGRQPLNETNITTLDLSNEAITYLGPDVFKNAYKIEEIELSDNIETIGDGCFQGCTSLKGVTLPASLKSLGAYSFEGCYSASYLDLSRIAEPQSEQAATDLEYLFDNLGTDAFANWNSDGGTIVWPEWLLDEKYSEVKSKIAEALVRAGLPEAWVDGTHTDPESALTSGIPITFDGQEILIIDENNVLTGINGANLQLYMDQIGAEAASNMRLVIPSRVEKIADNFWSNCSFQGEQADKIKSLVVANNSNLNEIGASAFAGCTNFTGDLYLAGANQNPVKIGANAFNGCTGFDGTLTLPKYTSIIETCAFQNCSKFTRLNLNYMEADYIVSLYQYYIEHTEEQCIGLNAFDDFGSTTQIDSLFVIFSSSLNQISDPTVYNARSWFRNELTSVTHGNLDANAIGENVLKFEPSEQYEPITKEEFEEAGIELAISSNEKQDIVDYYLSVLANGTGGLTSEQVIEQDLLLSIKRVFTTRYKSLLEKMGLDFEKYMTFNIKLSDVSISGEYLTFDIQGDVDMDLTQSPYSDYACGYTFQFHTKFENVRIRGFNGGMPITTTSNNPDDMDFAANMSIMFDQNTNIKTYYDFQSIYRYNDEGVMYRTYIKSVIPEGENTYVEYSSDNFQELLDNYPNIWDGEAQGYTGSAGGRLFNLTQELYDTAPSALAVVFDCYSLDDTMYYEIDLIEREPEEGETVYPVNPFADAQPDGEETIVYPQLSSSYEGCKLKFNSHLLGNAPIYPDTSGNSNGSADIAVFESKMAASAQTVASEQAALTMYTDYVTQLAQTTPTNWKQKLQADVMGGIASNLRKLANEVFEEEKQTNYPIVEWDNRWIRSQVDPWFNSSGQLTGIDFYLNIEMAYRSAYNLVSARDKFNYMKELYVGSNGGDYNIIFRNVQPDSIVNFTMPDGSQKIGIGWLICSQEQTESLGIRLELSQNMYKYHYDDKYELVINYDTDGGVSREFTWESGFDEILFDGSGAKRTKSDIENQIKTIWPTLAALDLVRVVGTEGHYRVIFAYYSPYMQNITIGK